MIYRRILNWCWSETSLLHLKPNSLVVSSKTVGYQTLIDLEYQSLLINLCTPIYENSFIVQMFYFCSIIENKVSFKESSLLSHQYGITIS